MFKKIYNICAIFIFAAAIFILPARKISNKAYADGVAEVAIELSSGTVLHEKNADMRLPMASTTKIMTALIIAEECDLNEIITVDDSAIGVEGSSIYLKKGERISIRDLLYGLMLRSGNDASVALAIYHSGSIDEFVEKMNTKAKQIGAENTHFNNPNGLPDEEHYTTARDLAKIAATAMNNKTFKEIVGCKSYKGDFRNFTNKNKLLNKLEGANGVKTGYTQKAGKCLVSSVQRDDIDILCVVLNCFDMYERSAKIIESCFENYDFKTLYANKAFEYRGQILHLDEDCRLIFKKNGALDYKIESHGLCDNKLLIYCENHLIFSHNLYNIN